VLGLVNATPGSGSKDVCLAELDPANRLAATRTACGLPLFSEPDSTVSPDGHWLVARLATSQWGLIDLRTVFTHPAIARSWTADVAGSWTDASTLLSLVSGKLTRIDVTTGATAPVTTPGLPPGSEVQLAPTGLSD
jgi:hypothetical protein